MAEIRMKKAVQALVYHLDSPQCVAWTVVGHSRGGLRSMETAMLKPGLEKRETAMVYSTVRRTKRMLSHMIMSLQKHSNAG